MNRILIENDTIRSRNLILESRNLDVIMSGKRFLKNIHENITEKFSGKFSEKISVKISEKNSENILKANVDKDLKNCIKLADSINIENKENLLNNISQNDDFENCMKDELYDSLDNKENKINISNNSNNKQMKKLNGNDLKNEIIHSNNMKKNNKKSDIENTKNINKNMNKSFDNKNNSNNNNDNGNNNNNDINNHNISYHVSNNSNYTNSTDIYEIQDFDLNVLEGGRGVRLCAKLKKIAQEKDILKKVRKSSIN